MWYQRGAAQLQLQSAVEEVTVVFMIQQMMLSMENQRVKT